MQNTTQPERNGNRATPGTLAEALRPFLQPGDGAQVADARTSVPVHEAAAMLADLAARLAAIDPATIPGKLSISLGIQPDVHDYHGEGYAGHGPEVAEAREVQLIDAIVGHLAPGVVPYRDLMDSTVHYMQRLRPAGGMGVSVYTGVTPTEAEAATMLRDKVARAHRARVLPYHTAASQKVPAAERPMVAECACGEYRSATGTHDEVVKRHAQHRATAVRKTLVAAAAVAPPGWQRAVRAADGVPDCPSCGWFVPGGVVNRPAALAVHQLANHPEVK